MQTLLQTQAADSPVEAMQIESSTPRSFSIPGLPTETAPITNAIDLNYSGVPVPENCSTYSDIVLSWAFELVPIILVPMGRRDRTSFLMTLSRVADPVAALTLNFVRHWAIIAANVLYVRGTRSIGETSINAFC